MDHRLEELIRARPNARLISCSLEEDPSIRWRLWVLDVPPGQLCRVQDEIIARALELFGSEPLPILVSVATPEKTRALLGESSPRSTATVSLRQVSTPMFAAAASLMIVANPGQCVATDTAAIVRFVLTGDAPGYSAGTKVEYLSRLNGEQRP